MPPPPPPVVIVPSYQHSRSRTRKCGIYLVLFRFDLQWHHLSQVFWQFKDAYDSGWWVLALISGLMLIVGILSWYTMKVCKLEPEKPVSPEAPGSG